MKSLSQLKAECPENPVDACDYWEEVLQNLRKYSGWSIEEFKSKINTAIQTLRDLSEKLDKLSTDAGISKTVGGGASIAGGTMAIAGIFLAPFTGGASLAMTVGGAALGVSGGATTLGATIAKGTIERNTAEEANEKTKEALDMITYLAGILSEYIMQLGKAGEYLQQQFSLGKINQFSDRKVYQYIKDTFSTTKQVAGAVSTGRSLSAAVKDFKDLKEVARLTGVANSKAAMVLVGYRSSTSLATKVSAPGVKIFGKTLVTAGSTSAKLLSGAFGALGIGFGIWDCVEGASEIKNGSEVAKSFREAANSMEKEKNELLETYNELTKD